MGGGSNSLLTTRTATKRAGWSSCHIEEEEGDHAPLTVSPWGTQDGGEKGLQGDVRAGGSDGRKGTSATTDGGETRGRH